VSEVSGREVPRSFYPVSYLASRFSEVNKVSLSPTPFQESIFGELEESDSRDAT